MSVTGRDVRFVDTAYTGDPNAAVRPPVTLEHAVDQVSRILTNAIRLSEA
jgi:hypothetical protein